MLELEDENIKHNHIKTISSQVSYYENALFKKDDINKPFYFMRHGQTDTNSTMLASKNSDISLNKNGIMQVHKAALFLKNKNIKMIISSSLNRAKETAEIINQQLNVPIIYDDGLKEIDLQFKVGEDINLSSKTKLWKKGEKIDGVESLYDFQMRIRNTIKNILNKYDQEVLIISHGQYFINMVVLLNQEYKNANNSEIFHISPINNNSRFKIEKIN